MSELEKLKNSESLSDIAALLRYDPKSFSYILYKIPQDKKYTTFLIPKKSGGTREISAPTPKLKKLQSKLADLLWKCTEELLSVEERLEKDTIKNKTRKRAARALAHGFKKGLSIASNAELHKKKKFVLNLDLENFFPSINFGRVRGFFIKNKNFNLAPKVATILAQIACYENALPQGSPCSPVISNLIGQILDTRLVKLAKKHKCTYSRYVDDITFSTNLNSFPKKLAYKKSQKHSDWLIGEELMSHIVNAGFQINLSKVRMQYENSRQVVTGLIVNRVVNTKPEYYRYARSMCHELFSKGTFYLPALKVDEKKAPRRKWAHFSNSLHNLWNVIPATIHKIFGNEEALKSAKKQDRKLAEPTSIAQLEGILSYIYHIKNYRNKYAEEGYRKSRHDGYRTPKHDTDTPKYPPLNRNNQYADESHQTSIDGIKNLYAKFLFFKHFHALEKPLIFCEGKTDNIYLKCALKKLITNYPDLVEITDKKVKYKVNFFNRTETVSEMLKLAEGAGGMKFIMLGYERLMRRYRCPGKHHPVIMIVDNDPAGRDVIKAASKYLTPEKPLPHIIENLYIFPLPKIGKKDTDMEDYFEAKILNTELNGKKFNRKNDSANDKDEYGKSAFARDVVQRNQDSIDFSEFKKILDSIVKIMNEYEPKSP